MKNKRKLYVFYLHFFRFAFVTTTTTSYYLRIIKELNGHHYRGHILKAEVSRRMYEISDGATTQR